MSERLTCFALRSLFVCQRSRKVAVMEFSVQIQKKFQERHRFEFDLPSNLSIGRLLLEVEREIERGISISICSMHFTIP